MSEDKTTALETENLDAPPVVEEQPAAGTGDTEKSGATEPDWFVREKSKLARQRRAAREERDAALIEAATLRKQLEELGHAQPKAAAQPQPIDRAELVRQVRMEEKSNETYERGMKEIPGFEKAVAAFGQAFGEDVAQRPDFFEVLGELPDAHKVYFALANDPAQMSQLLELTPAKMALSLARYAEKVTKQPKPVSKAPPPPQPLTGNGSTETGYRNDMSMADYDALRRAKKI